MAFTVLLNVSLIVFYLSCYLLRLKTQVQAVYFLPSLFTSFLSLLSFFRASASIHGRSLALAWSICTWSPRIHTFILGFGTCINLKPNSYNITDVRRQIKTLGQHWIRPLLNCFFYKSCIFYEHRNISWICQVFLQ